MMEMVALRTGGRDAAAMLGQRSAASWAMAEQRLGVVPYFGGDAFSASDNIPIRDSDADGSICHEQIDPLVPAALVHEA